MTMIKCHFSWTTICYRFYWIMVNFSSWHFYHIEKFRNVLIFEYLVEYKFDWFIPWIWLIYKKSFTNEFIKLKYKSSSFFFNFTIVWTIVWTVCKELMKMLIGRSVREVEVYIYRYCDWGRVIYGIVDIDMPRHVLFSLLLQCVTSHRVMGCHLTNQLFAYPGEKTPLPTRMMDWKRYG